MNKFLKTLIPAALFSIGSVASAAVLDFEGLANDQVIPSNYGGFNWDSNIIALSQAAYQSYGNTYSFVSGQGAVYNGYGVLTVSVGGSEFDFTGAFFSGWRDHNSLVSFTATSVTVNGYDGASLVGSVTTSLTGNSFTWLDAQFENVTSLQIVSSSSGNWWLMDNFTYNENSSVPDGGSHLVAAGLGILALARLCTRRKK